MQTKNEICTKCKKENPKMDNSDDKLCSECKKKRKNLLLWGLIGLAVVGIGTAVLFFNYDKTTKVVGFDKVGNINDSMSIKQIQEIPEFKMENTLAISSPVNANGIIDNIESFNRAMEQEIENAKKNNSQQLQIPPISTFFDLVSAKVSPEGIKLLEEYSKIYLQTNKEATLLVEGYTCDLGTHKINQKLSEQRANSVKEVLVSNGIPENKIAIKWYGEEKFTSFNYSDKKDYRRVNISIE